MKDEAPEQGIGQPIFGTSESSVGPVLDAVTNLQRPQVKALAHLLASRTQQVASDEEIVVRERLYTLSTAKAAEDPPDIFDKLCAAVVKAYPLESLLNDGEILANSATPDLVRYLVSALKQFSESSTAKSRDRVLAKALRAKRSAGAPGRIRLMREEMLNAAQAAIDEALKAGSSVEVADRNALAAAYSVFRGTGPNAEAQDHSDRVASLKAIRCFLVEAGCLLVTSKAKRRPK